MRRDVVYGPKEEHGLDLPNLYICQGTQHINYYVNHILEKNSICGKFLRNLSKQTKLELGTGEPLFNKYYENTQTYATPSWITHLW